MMLPTFILDPTEEEKQLLLDAGLKYIALDSDNPKDASIVGMCQEAKSKAVIDVRLDSLAKNFALVGKWAIILVIGFALIAVGKELFLEKLLGIVI